MAPKADKNYTDVYTCDEPFCKKDWIAASKKTGEDGLTPITKLLQPKK
jgi:hypothetical protein